MTRINLFVVALITLLLSACGPPKVDEYVDIKPSETAYVIPLEGASKAGQGKFESEQYLEANKVAAKRIYLPLRDVDTGRWWWNYKWIPTVQVIRVDRKPVTFVWSDKTGIQVESKDSIGFTVGINMSGVVLEKNTSKFLYNYPSGNITSVLNDIVKSKTTEILSREFAKYDLEGDDDNPGARQMKGSIVDIAKAEIISFFEPTGLTITTFGLIGGLAYDDVEIQSAINDNFKSELDIKNKENERLAQNKINEKNISKAQAEKEAAQKFAEAAEDRKKMVELDIATMNAKARLTIAERWDGKMPMNIVPEGSGFIFDIGKGTPTE